MAGGILGFQSSTTFRLPIGTLGLVRDYQFSFLSHSYRAREDGSGPGLELELGWIQDYQWDGEWGRDVVKVPSLIPFSAG